MTDNYLYAYPESEYRLPRESMFMLVVAAGIALLIGVMANKFVSKSAMGLTFGITSALIVSMVNIRKALILALVFAAFNAAHLLIDTSVTIKTEPFLNKAMKDFLLLGVYISFFRSMVLNDLEPPQRLPVVVILLMCLFVLGHGLIFRSGSFWVTFTWYRHYIAHPVLVLIAARAFRSLDEILLLFKWMMWVSVVIVAIGFLEQILDIPTQFQGVVSYWIFNRRVISTLGQPVNVYQYMGLPIFFVLMGWILDVIKPHKAFLWLTVLGYGVFITFTRLAFVAYPAGLMFLAPSVKKTKTIYIGLVLLLAALMAFPLVMTARDKYGEVTGNALSSRDVMLKNELREIFSNPKTFIVGEGMGTGFELGFQKAYFKTTDNIYTSWWKSTGIIGFLVFLTTFAAIGIKLLKTYKMCITPIGKQIVGAVMGNYFLLVIAGLACEVFKFYPATFIFWISVGIAFSVPSLEEKELIYDEELYGCETDYQEYRCQN